MIVGSFIASRRRYAHQTRLLVSIPLNRRQDAETVATTLQEESKGRIRTGVYHADIPDAQKEGLHRQWRAGSVQVVCATIGKHVFAPFYPNRAYMDFFNSIWTGHRQGECTLRNASYGKEMSIFSVVV